VAAVLATPARSTRIVTTAPSFASFTVRALPSIDLPVPCTKSGAASVHRCSP
jgi:hypothetical protein